MRNTYDTIDKQALEDSLKVLQSEKIENTKECVDKFNSIKEELNTLSKNHDNFLSDIDFNGAISNIKAASSTYQFLVNSVSKKSSDINEADNLSLGTTIGGIAGAITGIPNGAIIGSILSETIGDTISDNIDEITDKFKDVVIDTINSSNEGKITDDSNSNSNSSSTDNNDIISNFTGNISGDDGTESNSLGREKIEQDEQRILEEEKRREHEIKEQQRIEEEKQKEQSLKEEQNRLEEEQNRLEEEQNRLEEEQKRLEEEQKRLEEEQKRLEEEQKQKELEQLTENNQSSNKNENEIMDEDSVNKSENTTEHLSSENSQNNQMSNNNYHIGGGYSEQVGFTSTNTQLNSAELSNNSVSKGPNLLTPTDEETPISDLLNDSSASLDNVIINNNKLPSSEIPLPTDKTEYKKSSIPLIAGLAAAATAGVSTKAYLDKKDSKEDDLKLESSKGNNNLPFIYINDEKKEKEEENLLDLN